MGTIYSNTAATSVETTLSEDSALDTGANAAEHCAIDPASLTALDSELDRQVLIRLDAGPVALYTVTEHAAGGEPATHVGKEGRTRLASATTLPAGARIETGFTSDATSGTRLTEELLGTEARGLAILCPHGGDIEPFTHEQAERVYNVLAQQGKPAQAWITRGYNSTGAHKCWHITSSEISEHSFPKLATLFSPDRAFAHAVAFHGHGGTAVFVGGGLVDDPEHAALKETLRARIKSVVGAVEVKILTSGALAGALPRNIVNRVPALHNGIQIEQPYSVRANATRRVAIADAVAAVYAELI